MSNAEEGFRQFQARHKAAREAWGQGATTKEIAQILDVTVESARKHKKRWAREDVKHLIPKAFSALRTAGFLDEDISVLLDASPPPPFSWREEQERIEKLPIEQRPVNYLTLNARPANILERLSIKTIGDLCNIPEWNLRATKGCGAKTVDEIIEELERHGLKLAD